MTHQLFCNFYHDQVNSNVYFENMHFKKNRRVAVKYYNWWITTRDPRNIGLVAVIHSWESGMDGNLHRVCNFILTPFFNYSQPSL